VKNVDCADDWYADQDQWAEEVRLLREIVLSFGLTETIKWKHPCYMDNGKNVIIISHRKAGAVCALLKGALVHDPRGRLKQAGTNRYDRYMPFEDLAELQADRAYLEDLIRQNLEASRQGLELPPLPDELDLVPELRERMEADPAFCEAFEALTKGRQRGYNLYFGKAKRSETRVARIEAATERIFMGKGQMDCICGHSKRKPRCDGSHRQLPTD